MTTTAEAQTLLVKLLDPSNRSNPYPVYDQIRERGPLRMPESNLTVFSSFDECDEVLRHPASASDGMKSTVVQRQIAQGAAFSPARAGGVPVPRPAGPHAAAQTGQQGVRAEGSQGPRTRHHRDGRRAAR
jgi:cytochrome P450